MPETNEFVRMLDEVMSGRLAAVDLTAIENPRVRALEAQRRASEEAHRQPDALLTIKELAAELRVSVRTLRRRNKHSDAPQRVKRGRRLMYRRADVQQWLERSGGKLGTKIDASATAKASDGGPKQVGEIIGSAVKANEELR